jgi:hypothetical protein
VSSTPLNSLKNLTLSVKAFGTALLLFWLAACNGEEIPQQKSLQKDIDSAEALLLT